MKIDCIADLHGHYPELEGGDLLIIAGDLTAADTSKQMKEFEEWIHSQNYLKKVVIAGNHDNSLVDKSPEVIQKVFQNGLSQRLRQLEIFEYLCDSGTEFEGLKIWGSPWSPYFKNVNPACTAFMLPDEALFYKWEMIPKGTDILITHTPPYGTLDYREMDDGTRYHMGSKSLEDWIKRGGRPQYHFFGHIHECGSMQAEEYPTYNDKMMKSINCSYVDARYRPVNKPIRIER